MRSRTCRSVPPFVRGVVDPCIVRPMTDANSFITTSGDMPDLDAMAAAGREHAKQIYPFKYLGAVWHARNSVPFGKLLESISDDNDLGDVLDAIAAFVVAEEREAFIEAIKASDDVDIPELTMLSKFFNEKSQEAVGNAAS